MAERNTYCQNYVDLGGHLDLAQDMMELLGQDFGVKFLPFIKDYISTFDKSKFDMLGCIKREIILYHLLQWFALKNQGKNILKGIDIPQLREVFDLEVTYYLERQGYNKPIRLVPTLSPARIAS